ncbi:MAG: nucleotidyl transferase AbiEii/AbiGii toxin family protein [Candidatus Wallbacteria bacterium]|nr:nucleotidyl transferase AbiEii/AbiGii toxin family protein [Candidatus Wallbacteria bacterium]
MKDHLAQLLRSSSSPLQGRNLAREYLQARILGAMQRSGAMLSLAFHGGTALRFLYSLPRYSEDLDFALERSPQRYDLRRCLDAVKSELTAEGYGVEVRLSDRRTVHSAFVRLPGLLHELGLSAQRTEVLAVKLEVDTNPPSGARLETSLVRRHVLVQLQHHDRSSLLAGKLHCVLARPYAKGRDFFDLMWYLGDRSWPEPNLQMLNAALRQAGWSKAALTPKSWRKAAADKLDSIDWSRVTTDIRPFLESPGEAAMLTKENLRKLLRRASP